jgi:hypothetical protein
VEILSRISIETKINNFGHHRKMHLASNQLVANPTFKCSIYLCLSKMLTIVCMDMLRQSVESKLLP